MTGWGRNTLPPGESKPRSGFGEGGREGKGEREGKGKGKAKAKAKAKAEAPHLLALNFICHQTSQVFRIALITLGAKS